MSAEAPELAASILLDLHLHQAAMNSNPLLWFSFWLQAATVILLSLIHSLTLPGSASISPLSNLFSQPTSPCQPTFHLNPNLVTKPPQRH